MSEDSDPVEMFAELRKSSVSVNDAVCNHSEFSVIGEFTSIVVIGF